MINIVKGDRAITYTEEKNFTPQQVAELFLSVRWVVGKYPDRLYKALMNFISCDFCLGWRSFNRSYSCHGR